MRIFIVKTEVKIFWLFDFLKNFIFWEILEEKKKCSKLNHHITLILKSFEKYVSLPAVSILTDRECRRYFHLKK